MKPIRIQLRRTKDWRKPENTVVVSRPSRYGNPFIIGGFKAFQNDQDPNGPITIIQTRSQEEAVEHFRWLAEQSRYREKVIRDLRGKNLACWCKPGTPCHADILLEIANS